MERTIRIGTRGSALALWQADHVAALLRQAHPELRVERVVIKTKGDRILDKPLAAIGDKGLFTKELEVALLAGEVDLAVHSMKDVPTAAVPGLVLGAVPARGPAADAFLSNRWGSLDEVPIGGTVATGSLRREALLRHARPDLTVVDIRGNLQTRLRKLDASDWDGLILAVAGLERMELGHRIAERLPMTRFIPAVGQGALFVQAKEGDSVLKLLEPIEDGDTAAAVRAERRFMAELEGGCQVPLGAHALVDRATGGGEIVRIEGFVARRDGSELVRRSAEGALADPEQVGRELAARIREAGGGAILEDVRAEGPAFEAPAPKRS